MAAKIRAAAHTRAGGKVTVPSPTRSARSAPAAVSAPPAPPQAPTVTPNPAGSPVTVPGGATVKPPKPVTGVKPHHFIPQTTQTVGTNPNPPAKRSASTDAAGAPPVSTIGGLGNTSFYTTY